jgi:hypothetical protein
MRPPRYPHDTWRCLARRVAAATGSLVTVTMRAATPSTGTLGTGAMAQPGKSAGRCLTGVDLIETGRLNSERLINSPMTRSCMYSAWEKHIVRRTSRVIRVCRLLCVRAIVWGFALSPWCCSASRWRSYAPQPSVDNCVRPKGCKSAGTGRKPSACRRPHTYAKPGPVSCAMACHTQRGCACCAT